MVGKPGRSGGARVGAGAPPGSGGAREGAGRPPGVGDTTLSAARILSPGQKWAFAEKALQHAERMLGPGSGLTASGLRSGNVWRRRRPVHALPMVPGGISMYD